MPNVGRPSRGCKQCKARKLKCDEAHPTCRRCQRNGRQCSGYPTEIDVTFRNTLSLVPSLERRTSPISDIPESHPPSNISAPMSWDWHSQAITMFFYDYVIASQTSNTGKGYLQCLPKVYEEGESPAIKEALSAVALTSLAQRTSSDYLSVQARRQYGFALKLVSSSLVDHKMMKSDGTLAAIMLLDFYEIISGERNRSKNWYSCHLDGLDLILKARDVDPSLSAASHSLTYNASLYTQMRNLGLHLRPSKETEALARSSLREVTLRQHGILVCETCHFLAESDELVLKADLSASVNKRLLMGAIQKGIAIYDRLEDWSNQLPEHFGYSCINAPHLEPASTIETYSCATIHMYHNVSIALLWNIHRLTRLLLLENIRKCMSLFTKIAIGQSISALTGHVTENWTPTNIIRFDSQTQDRIDSLVDDVCASVSYLLGEIDQEGKLQSAPQMKAIGGLYLLFPLNSILIMSSVDAARMTWISGQLIFIKNSLGIREAVMHERYTCP